MAFLTPFYLLAGLAVGLPIFFHLIRQTPKGRQVFSSLMFLEPSPPKVTQRSRVEDWLLLILRALAVCLLALAFARPFLRSQAEAAFEKDDGRRFVILLDTSASMQRENLWEMAQDEVDQILKSVEPADAVSVLSFNDTTNSVISLAEWTNLESSARESLLREKLKELHPTDLGTNLGSAMIFATDHLVEQEGRQNSESKLIVVSDFQTGSQWEQLNGFPWPENVQVELIPLKVEETTNAAAQLIANQSASDNAVRVRVSNSSLSEQEQFQLGWIDEFSTDESLGQTEDSVSVYVPPGQSRVVLAPTPTQNRIPQRLKLSGDQQSFDNICYVARRLPWEANVLFIGEEEKTGPESLRFFLEPVLPSTVTRTVQIFDWLESENEPPLEEASISLVIIGEEVNEQQLIWCREWFKAGGRGIFIARDSEQAAQLYSLLEVAPKPVLEADALDYEMLGSVDFTHPVFTPFDDPRFADFSKLRFWKHRVIDVDSIPEAKVLASFEENSPAIIEVPVGKGRLVVFSSGWNRSDSDLAVWSKFVPMMNGFLEYLGKQREFDPVNYVGGELNLAQFHFDTELVSIRNPDGEVVAGNVNDKLQLTQKGIYTIAGTEGDLADENAVRLAVNLPPEESKTDPISVDLLKAAGVPIRAQTLSNIEDPQSSENQRQLMNRELESQQKLWKWILLLAIILLLSETILAGLRQRRTGSTLPFTGA